MIQEFKEFAIKGNMLDMAVGIIMGAAFGGVISGLVGDVIMPVVGTLTGGVDFKDQFVSLGGAAFKTLDEAKKAGAPVLAWGAWVNTIINFLIVAFCMYMIVKAMNKLKMSAAPPPTPPSEVLLAEIRDLLARNRSAVAGD
jgi:large conductance mechanosensitive channel